jgi:hypothetical protein
MAHRDGIRLADSVNPVLTINVRPIALLTALLLFFAIHASYLMSASLQIVEWCVPYIDGCTSISRASRSQPVIFFFRSLMMPAGLGLLFCVLLLRHWLLSLGAPRNADMNLIVLVGFLAVAGLLIYCAFLGTGAVFRPYRRYSVISFLGFFMIAQLIVCKQLTLLMKKGIGTRALKRVLQMMIAVGVAQVIFGVINIAVVPFLENNDAIENAIEWNVCGLMVTFVVLIHAGWKVTGFSGRFSIAPELNTQPS